METVLALISLLALAGNGPGAAEPDWSGLCKILEQPEPFLSSQFNLGITFDDWGEFYRHDKEQIRPTIEELRRSLKGNSRDAATCFRLSKLCSRVGERNQAHEWIRKAIGFYRTKVKSSPNDAALLCRLGEVLMWNEGNAEARLIFQRARALAPTAWEVWAGLARLKESRLENYFWRKDQPPGVRDGSPSVLDKKKLARWLDEAGTLYDKAIACAPDEPGPYARRAMYHLRRSLHEQRLHGNLARSPTNEYSFATANPDLLADLYLAALKGPPNALALAGPVFAELSGAGKAMELHLDDAGERRKLWDAFPPRSKKRILRTFAKLEALGGSEDHAAAAEAFEALAMLRLDLGQDTAAEYALVRAVQADPRCRPASEILRYVYAYSGKYVDLLRLCQKRIAQQESSMDYFLLARSYDSVRSPAEAEKAMRAALRLGPKELLPNLGLAVLLLERCACEDSTNRAGELAEVKALLDTAEKSVNKLTPRVNQVRFTVARSAYLALSGDVPQARKLLEGIIQEDEESKEARTMLELLQPQAGDPPPPPPAP
jgi:tetratricopeptide (TPR) repeat protein